jgi:hypothetical protein
MSLLAKNRNNRSIVSIMEPTLGNIIYSKTGSPFKFVLDRNWSEIDEPSISSLKYASVPYYNILRLDYSDMPVGKNMALVGTVKNMGTVDAEEVRIYASVHNK